MDTVLIQGDAATMAKINQIKYIKHIKYTDTEDKTVYRYFSKDELEDALKRPEYRLFLFKEDGAVITKTDIFPK